MTRAICEKDEFNHDWEGLSNFNESMYFNFFDHNTGIGGFFRLGNRPYEGYAEETVCIYLLDTRAVFNYRKPSISGNDGFSTDNFKLEVIEPLKRLAFNLDGTAFELNNPSDLEDPKRAFLNAKELKIFAELNLSSCSDIFGGEADRESNEYEFAKGHYEQLVKVEGVLEIGSEHYDLYSFGLRDHSWGKRSWQSPLYYRWLTGNFSEEEGFMATEIVLKNGEKIVQGFLVDKKDGMHLLRDVTIKNDWDEKYWCNHIDVSFDLDGSRKKIEGEINMSLPLRNRKTIDGQVLATRILEGYTTWHFEHRRGLGISEYLDQLLEGIPAGAI